MLKKKNTPEKATPTFEIRLIGPGLLPEKIPLRSVSDVLSAIQDLASGRDPDEQKYVPHEKGIGLMNVKRGSAVYCCVSRSPTEAVENLSRIGKLLRSPSEEENPSDGIVAALRPIQSLSEVAKSVGCQIEVSVTGHRKEPIFTVEEDAFQRISGRLFVFGETTLYGKIERVGGATDMRCLLRIPGRRHLLYCDVATKELAQRLGQHLYEDVAASGTAQWINRTWKVYHFKINNFTQPRIENNTSKIIEELRNAGLSAWDNIDSPEQYLRELRS
jgi:hypothetical protein